MNTETATPDGKYNDARKLTTLLVAMATVDRHSCNWFLWLQLNFTTTPANLDIISNLDHSTAVLSNPVKIRNLLNACYPPIENQIIAISNRCTVNEETD